MGLTGAPKPTNRYARFVYGSPSITLDWSDPLQLFSPPDQAVRGENLAPLSGRREVLYGRLEERIKVVSPLTLSPAEYEATRTFFRNHAGQGKQFEFFLDRFTGSAWEFNGVLTDQNSLALTLTGSAVYEASPDGQAFVFASGNVLSVATAKVLASNIDAPLIKEEGVIVLKVKPDWAGNDGLAHFFVDCAMAATQNRLSVYKTAGNELRIEIYDASVGSVKSKGIAVSWSANTWLTIVARWKTDGVLDLWLDVGQTGTFTQATVSAGAGTGILGALAATLFVGSDNASGNKATGRYDRVFFNKRGWTDPTTLLPAFNPITRNYWGVAEHVESGYEMARPVLGKEIWQWGATIRLGIA